MTTLACVMARSYAADMFDDLEVPAHVRAFDKSSGVTTLTFDGELSEEQQQQICDRMTSRNDVDQAARANLRDLRDQLANAPDPATLGEAMVLVGLLTTAVVDSLNYWLGEG